VIVNLNDSMLNKLLIFNIIPATLLINFSIANSYDDNSGTSKPLMEIRYSDKELRIKGDYIPFTDHGVTGDKPLLYTQRDDRTVGRDNNDWCNGQLPKSLKEKIPHDNGGWIALIFIDNTYTTRNGYPRNRTQSCKCSEKLRTAYMNNASAAIILLPTKDDNYCSQQQYSRVTIVGVTVDDQNDVQKLRRIITEHHPNDMHCTIKIQPKTPDKQFRVSKTSVLFVLVSFILLMCISLAWLVFYYVQRFRHIYRNDRKEKQLLSAAKKAISKLKTISFNSATLDGEVSCLN
jgi:hypothetical protein